MSDDIAAFITARLDEDEAAARAWRSPNWERHDHAVYMDLGGGSRLVAECPLPHSGEPSPTEHIARHDPARVLREVAAKRRILAWHEAECTCTWVDEHGYDLDQPDPTGLSCPTIVMLALPYADHADYRPEWAL